MIPGSPREWLRSNGFQFETSAYWVWVWRRDAAGRAVGVRRFTSIHRAARILQGEFNP